MAEAVAVGEEASVAAGDVVKEHEVNLSTVSRVGVLLCKGWGSSMRILRHLAFRVVICHKIRMLCFSGKEKLAWI